MKTGKTLQELAAEVKRQADTKRDYVASTAAIEVTTEKSELRFGLKNHGQFAVGDIAHGQVAAHTKIPQPYYSRMREEAPELLVNNIETWFRKHPAPRMLRMLDGRNRAFLSNSFRPLDNYDFANVVLEACSERALDVVSCEVTEKRMYIKAIDKQEFQVPVGHKMGDGSHVIFDVCCPVFIASNSEVGYGRLTLETGVYTSACTNLAWFSDGSFRKTHLGSRHKIVEATGVEDFDHLLSHRTRQKSDEALWLQLRDVMKAGFDEGHIRRRAKMLEEAAEQKIDGSAVAGIVPVLQVRLGLTEREAGDVLGHLINGGQLTKYGLHAAVTRASQDADDYDRATELEYIGGGIIEMPRTEWEELLAAA